MEQYYVATALRMPMNRVKISIPDIGGGFGNKVNWWKDVVVCAASRITEIDPSNGLRIEERI